MHEGYHLHEQEEGFIDQRQQHAIDHKARPVLRQTGLHAQVLYQGQSGGKYLQGYLDLFSIPFMKTCFESLHAWAYQVDSLVLLDLRDPSR